MGDRIKKIFGKIKETIGKMSKGLKAAIILLLLLCIGGIIALSVYRSNKPYTVLFTGLSEDDFRSVVTYLNTNNVSDFRIENGDTILVREDREVELKAAILQEGYPTSGYAYTTYLDNIGVLASESDRRQLSTYDLQDQLKAVIRRFDGVRDANVNIALSGSNRYILSDTVQTATAAVSVTMQNGRPLTDKLALAIRNYVTHSVQGLSFSDVEIMDSAGNRYTGDEYSLSDEADTKLSLQEMINTQVRNSVVAVLSPYFGLPNVSVSVHSVVDTSRTYTEVLNYLEPEWAAQNRDGRGIIGTWIWDSGVIRGGENEENAGGTVGTGANADLNEYVINEGDITLNGNEQEIGTSGQIDYKVGTQKSQTEVGGGLLTDLMVAVAINRSVLEGDLVRDDWVPLIARAAGIGPQLQNEKIAIQVYPFYVAPEIEPEPTEPTLAERLNLPWWARYAAIGGSILFLLLVVLIVILSRKIKKRRAEKKAQREAELARQKEQEAIEAQAAAEAAEAAAVAAEEAAAKAAEEMANQGADIMDMNTERTMALRKDVRSFAEENPAIAAQIIKQWLHGDDNA